MLNVIEIIWRLFLNSNMSVLIRMDLYSRSNYNMSFFTRFKYCQTMTEFGFTICMPYPFIESEIILFTIVTLWKTYTALIAWYWISWPKYAEKWEHFYSINEFLRVIFALRTNCKHITKRHKSPYTNELKLSLSVRQICIEHRTVPRGF